MSEILVSSSPLNREDVVGRFSVADATAVSHAVERARAALPGWRDLGFDGRSALLRRFREEGDDSRHLGRTEAGPAILAVVALPHAIDVETIVIDPTELDLVRKKAGEIKSWENERCAAIRAGR